MPETPDREICNTDVYFCIICQWLNFTSNIFSGVKSIIQSLVFSVFESSKAEVGGKGRRLLKQICEVC